MAAQPLEVLERLRIGLAVRPAGHQPPREIERCVDARGRTDPGRVRSGVEAGHQLRDRTDRDPAGLVRAFAAPPKVKKATPACASGLFFERRP